jgi:hypothetical protein
MAVEPDLQQVDDELRKVEADIQRVEEQITHATSEIDMLGGPGAATEPVTYWIKEKEQLRRKEEQLRRKEELLLQLQLEGSKGKCSQYIRKFFVEPF